MFGVKPNNVEIRRPSYLSLLLPDPILNKYLLLRCANTNMNLNIVYLFNLKLICFKKKSLKAIL